MTEKKNVETENIDYKSKIIIGTPRLTDFEKAKIIGIRAIQIQMGAPIYIDTKNLNDELEIAETELTSAVLPLSIQRSTSLLSAEGDKNISLPLKWLLEAEKEDLKVDI